VNKKSPLSAFLTAILIGGLVLASAMCFGTVNAKPSVPEFTLQYVDYSYDVPPTTTSTTDPYTGKTTTTTIPGYHVENKTIQATINNNIGASYYNFRYKGSYTDKWNYYPFDPDSLFGYNLPDAFYVPYKASTSSYTVAALPSYFFKDVPEGGQIDVQVQALFGDFDAEPFGHLFPLEPTYDFYFEGTTSDWSETQTITFGESQTPTPSPAATPTPTSPPATTPSPTPYTAAKRTEQETIAGAAITAAVIVAFLGLLIYLIKRK
jgi:hypothetical protein